jgi:hypothetical protein
MGSGDAGMETDKSNVGIENIGLIWMVGISVWMIMLQGLLLIIHRSGTSRLQNGQPTQTEMCVGIILFWSIQLGLGQILAGIGSIISFGLSDFTVNNQHAEGSHLDFRLAIYGMGFRWLWGGLVLLFSRVLITWYFHLGLVFFLDIGTPFWQELRRSPHKAFQKLELRLKEIVSFLESAFQDPFSEFSLLPRATSDQILKFNNQAIHLERRQTDHPSKGQRRLSWSIAVDKDALDEMKETLGPPGGFGELGFNVARDGVRFEAMGVGTSFNLMFKLREIEKNGKMDEIRIRKKQK